MKKKVTYRVKLEGWSEEWAYVSRKKRKAARWLKRLLKAEKASGYKYAGKVFKVVEQPLLKMKNY